MMAKAVLEALPGDAEAERNRAMVEFTLDWLLRNRNHIQKTDYTESYGFTTGSLYCVYPTVLKEAFKKSGFLPESALDALEEAGVLVTEKEGEGFHIRSLPKWNGEKTVRVYVLRYPDAEKNAAESNSDKETVIPPVRNVIMEEFSNKEDILATEAHVRKPVMT